MPKRKENETRTNMSDITFSCPSCSQHIACDETYQGDELRCPTCSEPLTVPDEQSATLAPLRPSKTTAKFMRAILEPLLDSAHGINALVALLCLLGFHYFAPGFFPPIAAVAGASALAVSLLGLPAQLTPRDLLFKANLLRTIFGVFVIIGVVLAWVNRACGTILLAGAIFFRDTPVEAAPLATRVCAFVLGAIVHLQASVSIEWLTEDLN
jgi:hypothetical protein